MRSRYTAYAIGDVGHVMRTTAAHSPHRLADTRAWRAELTEYCSRARFEGLQVVECAEDADQGWVTFFAKIFVDGREVSFGERSHFVRESGGWRYVDGVRLDAQ